MPGANASTVTVALCSCRLHSKLRWMQGLYKAYLAACTCSSKVAETTTQTYSEELLFASSLVEPSSSPGYVI